MPTDMRSNTVVSLDIPKGDIYFNWNEDFFSGKRRDSQEEAKKRKERFFFRKKDFFSLFGNRGELCKIFLTSSQSGARTERPLRLTVYLEVSEVRYSTWM